MSEIISLRCDHCGKEEMREDLSAVAEWWKCFVAERRPGAGQLAYDFCPDCWAAIHAEYVLDRKPEP